MSLRVRCPNGHALVLGDALAGKRVRCPKCKELFLVESEEEEAKPKKAKSAAKVTSKAAAPVKKKRKSDDDDEPPPKKKKKRVIDDEDEEDDSPGSSLSPQERRKRRLRDKKNRLKQVYKGLLIHIVKLWVVVLLVLAVFLLVVFQVTVDTGKIGDSAERLSNESIDIFKSLIEACRIGAAVLVAIAPIVGVTGCVFCMLIPKKSEARGTIVTSLVFEIIPLVASIVLPLAYFDVFALEPDKKSRLIDLLVYGSSFFSLGALFLFVIYLRLLAYYVQESILASEGLNLVSWLMIMTVSAPVVLVGLGLLAPILVGAVGPVLNLGIMFLITLGWFGAFYYLLFQGLIRLLNALRDSIAYATGIKKEGDEEEEEEEDDDED